MRIVRNDALIQRHRRIGLITLALSLLFLTIATISLFFSRPAITPLTIGSLLLSLVLTQLSAYYGSRWGRVPRPDQLLDGVLKGLPGKYVLYHYTTPVRHLLIGPAGVWVILPYLQKGIITYRKRRWRIQGGGFWQAYLRFFGHEALGRPDAEAEAECKALKKFLTTHFGEQAPEPKALLLFLDPQVELRFDEAPSTPALPAKKVKDFLRKAAKDSPLEEAWARKLQEILG